MITLRNEADLRWIMNKSESFIVSFYTDWCGPCMYVNKALKQWSKENSCIQVAKVDIDECEPIRQYFAVENLPSLVFIKDGEIEDRFEGGNCNRLKKLIEDFFAIRLKD